MYQILWWSGELLKKVSVSNSGLLLSEDKKLWSFLYLTRESPLWLYALRGGVQLDDKSALCILLMKMMRIMDSPKLKCEVYITHEDTTHHLLARVSLVRAVPLSTITAILNSSIWLNLHISFTGQTVLYNYIQDYRLNYNAFLARMLSCKPILSSNSMHNLE